MKHFNTNLICDQYNVFLNISKGEKIEMSGKWEPETNNILDSLRVHNNQIIIRNFNGYEFSVSSNLLEVNVKTVEIKIKSKNERWTRLLEINGELIDVTLGKKGVIALGKKGKLILFLKPDSTYFYN